MLNHQPDKTFKRLAGCWKRAAAFAAPGAIYLAHPLSAAWENCKMILDAAETPRVETAEDRREAAESICFDLVCLDWFAWRLDVFAEENMLAGDATVAAILQEWQDRMFFDPTKLCNRGK
jgi:hypothetical protein